MQEHVRNYYGETLTSSSDLQTNACCTDEAPPPHIRPILSAIHNYTSQCTELRFSVTD